MVQSNDPFWHHVEEMKCMYCGRQFHNNTSISRIKWHLSGEEGHGVAVCGQVPKQVQEAAFLDMRGRNKRHKGIASSSNFNDNAISTTPQEQNNEVDNVAGDAGTKQAADRMGHPLGRGGEEFCRWLMEDDLENGTGEVAQPGAGSSSSGGLTGNTSETRGDPLPTSSTKLVGRAFEENMNVIRSWLLDDEVSTIGIYGMGGVGKTTMLQHVHNELLERRDISHCVYWVTVSQDFSIKRLQTLIANCLGLDLSREDDDLLRAVKLSEELRKKQKWILILDDLWNTFELHEVGIPDSMKGCKLIMTTRSEKVCQRMNSQNKIKVKRLLESEAWTLFIKELGHGMTIFPELEQIAVDIARECAGLPLGIITIARSLRGVDDLHEWRDTLNKLKESKFMDIDHGVSRLFRFSYDRLDNLALQQCFLYCALFTEGHVIEREELICYLIDEGIIERKLSRRAAFDEGHAMLSRLEDFCLLERNDGGRYVKMHDLIRDMAIQILQENPSVMGQRKKWMGMVIQNDPEKVQDAARAAIDGPPEKKQKVIAGSSNNEVNNAIPTSEQKQNYEGRHVEMAQQGEAFSPTALKDCLDSIVDKEIELSINQADGPRGDSSSPKDLSCLGLGSYHDQLCSPSAKNDVIMDDVQNIVREKTEPVASMTEQSNTILNELTGDDGRIRVGVQGKEQGAEEELNCSHPEAESSMEYTCEGFIQQIDRNVSPERARLMENSSGRLVQTGTSASSTKLVGQAFEQNMKVIRSWLMDDEVSTIGIYGMGGVGKTTMLQHICNELLGRPGISQDVCWVTISQDFNIKKLQNLIAKCLDLDISSEDHDMSKTVKLAKELAKKQKWILIIDDLWNSFKPQEVGIPIPLKGSKLIMTTRSEMVCRQMNSQNNIRVDPLSDEESWTLFMDKLGQDKPLSPEVEQIAVDVARECAGLPLGIVTLAKSLKGVDDLFEWRITLKRLKESNFWDMEDQIFQILRLSYDCLDDSAQQCFTYCALFDEPHKIEREVLIGSFIEEGIIKEMNNGHSILDRLEDVCLLERIDGGSAVKMHDLLRDMAMHILDEYSLIMG